MYSFLTIYALGFLESGKKLIGNLRLLNKVLDDGVLWLNEDYKLIASRTDYDNFSFEIWHRKNLKPNKKELALLEYLHTHCLCHYNQQKPISDI